MRRKTTILAGKYIDKKQLDAILQNPQAKAVLLKNMGLDEPEYRRSNQHPNSSEGGGMIPSVWPLYPPPFWPDLFSPLPLLCGREGIVHKASGRKAQVPAPVPAT